MSPTPHDGASELGLCRAVLVGFASQAHPPARFQCGRSKKALSVMPALAALCVGRVAMAQQHGAEERDPQQLPFRLHGELLERHARRRRGAAMPATQFAKLTSACRARLQRSARRPQPSRPRPRLRLRPHPRRAAPRRGRRRPRLPAAPGRRLRLLQPAVPLAAARPAAPARATRAPAPAATHRTRAHVSASSRRDPQSCQSDFMARCRACSPAVRGAAMPATSPSQLVRGLPAAVAALGGGAGRRAGSARRRRRHRRPADAAQQSAIKFTCRRDFRPIAAACRRAGRRPSPACSATPPGCRRIAGPRSRVADECPDRRTRCGRAAAPAPAAARAVPAAARDPRTDDESSNALRGAGHVGRQPAFEALGERRDRHRPLAGNRDGVAAGRCRSGAPARWRACAAPITASASAARTVTTIARLILAEPEGVRRRCRRARRRAWRRCRRPSPSRRAPPAGRRRTDHARR